MRRSERARLLLRVVERLAQDEWPTIDLIVGQFEGRRTDEWQGSKQSYVGWSLELTSDAALGELGEFLGLSGQSGDGERHEIGIVEVSDVQRIWGRDPCFRLFLSHISPFKEQAAKIKEELVAYGISCFVAHADIQPTKEWLEEILRALRSMDALAALLVPDFHKSNWTDQEVGYALARNIPILPLKFEQDPYGFIGRFQALNCANLSPYEAASRVARLLIENSISQIAMADAVARQLAKSGSYARSKAIMDLLEIPATLPRATLELVVMAGTENSQVKEAWGVPDRIRHLAERHGFGELVQQLPTQTVDSDGMPF